MFSQLYYHLKPMNFHGSLRRFFLVGLVACSLLYATPAQAQIKAITDTGSEVFLYGDGTWKYAGDSPTIAAEVPLNDQPFTKPNNATFLVKSTKVGLGIWIDPKAWSFERGADEDAYEFQFERKGSDLYAMLIAEKTHIPLETLRTIAVDNAREAAPDVQVVKEEYRYVNGLKVLMIQMNGTIQGIKFTYFGYYYSNNNGTIQFLTYTGENLFEDYLNEIILFLNGLVELGTN